MAAVWDRRTAVEQERVRDLTLADWLPSAVEFAPHWGDVARSRGIGDDDLGSLGGLLRFPPSLQGDVAARGGTQLVQRPTESQVKAVAPSSLLVQIARGISQDQRDGKREVLLREFKPVHVTRGGVAGELAIASSRADLDRMHRVGARAASMLGLGDHDYLVSAVPSGPSADFWSVHALAMGSSMLGLHPRGHGDGLDRCIDAFSLLPATVVACPPQDAIPWARQLMAADADVSRVVVVLLVGPPPTQGHRDAIRQAWRDAGALESELVVRAMWAPDVHRSIWTECKAGIEGLHTTPDLEWLELLDPVTGLATGGPGDLTVTSMGWTGTTLLRHRTGHRVGGLTEGGTACPACGRTVPRVTGEVEPRAWQPELRQDDQIRTLDLRAIAIELDDEHVSAWRVVLVRGDGGQDGYELELGGDVTAQRARTVARRVQRATGITPAGVRVGADVATITGETRLTGSPFVDRR